MTARPPRFPLLDAWRSLALVLMVFYHFLYDLYVFGVLSRETMFCAPLNVLERFICCSFILLSGASARFSRSNLRRGLVVLLAALAVEAAAALVGQTIRFGVLMLLGSSMVLYHLVGRYLEKLPGAALAAGSLALFLLTWRWTRSVRVTVSWLYPLGFMGPGFYSADYFPLLPWAFLFFAGAAFGGWCLDHRDSRALTAPLPGPVTWPGRHSLPIYLVHQPVLYGLCYLLWGVRG